MSGWQAKPFVIEVADGDTKAFCMCGKSNNGPFCDGSHAGSDIVPQVVTFTEAKTIYACGCRHSGGLPYCDGSHKQLAV